MYKFFIVYEEYYNIAFVQYDCYIADQLSKITHIRQQRHTICTKSQIISTQELHLFQRYIVILMEILLQANVKLIHSIYVYNVKTHKWQ